MRRTANTHRIGQKSDNIAVGIGGDEQRERKADHGARKRDCRRHIALGNFGSLVVGVIRK